MASSRFSRTVSSIVLPSESTSVIVVDMQRSFLCCHERYGRARMIRAQRKVLCECAKKDVLVVLLEYEDHGRTINTLRRVTDRVPRVETITKRSDDGFAGTGLDEILRRLGIERLVFMGVNASSCVLQTAMAAVNHDYGIVTASCLISDCVNTEDGGTSRNWYSRVGVFTEGDVFFS